MGSQRFPDLRKAKIRLYRNRVLSYTADASIEAVLPPIEAPAVAPCRWKIDLWQVIIGTERPSTSGSRMRSASAMMRRRIMPGRCRGFRTRTGPHPAVSLVTARHALARLEREGLVERRRGAGTFVSAPKIHFNKLMMHLQSTCPAAGCFLVPACSCLRLWRTNRKLQNALRAFADPARW